MFETDDKRLLHTVQKSFGGFISPSAIQKAYKLGYRQFLLSWHWAPGCFAGIKPYGACDSSSHNWAIWAESPRPFTLPGHAHKREAEADQRPKRPGKERPEADHKAVKPKQKEMQKAVADVLWQSLLMVTGASEESCELAEHVMKHSNDKISVPTRAHSPRFHRASQPHLSEPDQTPPLISVPFSKR